MNQNILFLLITSAFSILSCNLKSNANSDDNRYRKFGIKKEVILKYSFKFGEPAEHGEIFSEKTFDKEGKITEFIEHFGNAFIKHKYYYNSAGNIAKIIDSTRTESESITINNYDTRNKFSYESHYNQDGSLAWKRYYNYNELDSLISEFVVTSKRDTPLITFYNYNKQTDHLEMKTQIQGIDTTIEKYKFDNNQRVCETFLPKNGQRYLSNYDKKGNLTFWANITENNDTLQSEEYTFSETSQLLKVKRMQTYFDITQKTYYQEIFSYKSKGILESKQSYEFIASSFEPTELYKYQYEYH